MAAQADPNYELAMLDAYCALVRVLDKSGAIRAQDVVDALHSAADVRRRDGDAEVSAGLHSVLRKLIEDVRVGHPPLQKVVG
jgi:hypothetical protein